MLVCTGLPRGRMWQLSVSLLLQFDPGSGAIKCTCAREQPEKNAQSQIVCLSPFSTGAQVFIHDRAADSSQESPALACFSTVQ